MKLKNVTFLLFSVAPQSCVIKFTHIIVLAVMHFENQNPQVHISSSKPECTLNLLLTSKKNVMFVWSFLSYWIFQCQ